MGPLCRLVVVLQTQISIFDINSMGVLQSLETPRNPRGTGSVVHTEGNAHAHRMSSVAHRVGVLAPPLAPLCLPPVALAAGRVNRAVRVLWQGGELAARVPEGDGGR